MQVEKGVHLPLSPQVPPLLPLWSDLTQAAMSILLFQLKAMITFAEGGLL